MNERNKKVGLYVLLAVFVAIIVWLLMRDQNNDTYQRREYVAPEIALPNLHEMLPSVFPAPSARGAISITQRGASCCSSCYDSNQITLNATPRDYESLTVDAGQAREIQTAKQPLDQVRTWFTSWTR